MTTTSTSPLVAAAVVAIVVVIVVVVVAFVVVAVEFDVDIVSLEKLCAPTTRGVVVFVTSLASLVVNDFVSEVSVVVVVVVAAVAAVVVVVVVVVVAVLDGASETGVSSGAAGNCVTSN